MTRLALYVLLLAAVFAAAAALGRAVGPLERGSAGTEEAAHGEETAGALSGVTRDDRPVRAEPYLGARGHLVVLRRGDLAYVHAHAEEERLVFETELPSPGTLQVPR